MRIVFAFRFFILDLFAQLTEEAALSSPPRTVSRGQFLPVGELETIKNNVGGLISNNTFLSATVDSAVAYIYAGNGARLPTHVSVVFEITADDKELLERPYASITRYSAKYDEKEVLFAMGTIFRIVSCEDYKLTWLVCLHVESQVSTCIKELSSNLRRCHMDDNTDVVTLGELLLEMGELEQAGQFFGLMLTQQIKEGNLDTVWLHNSIGSLHLAGSNFFMAKTLFKYCLTMTEDFDSPALERALLNNLGLAYLEQARYHRALKYLKRARKITATEDEMMDIYSNIGSVYCYQGKYRKAKRYLRRTLAIEQKNLPSLHYSVARTYNNLGSLEMQMGNYVEALNWHEQALKIYRQTVPSNHPSLAHALNNIGTTYSAMEQFDRAREQYEQALQVLMISFEPNRDENLLVLQVLSNLGTIQYEQNNYQAAEATFQRVLNLKLNIPGIGDQARHPSLAIAYNNLAMVQAKLGLFKEASTNYAHALDIEQSIGNAAALAITCNNLGGVHLEQNDFVNAERFFVQAYDTALTILPKEHPDIQLYQHNIEKTKMKRK